VNIVKLNEKHLDLIAKLHKENFSEEHTTFYLREELIKEYYRQFFREDEIFFLGLEDNGKLLGIILGGNKNKLAYCKEKFIKDHKKSLTKNILVSTVAKPKFIYKLFYERIILKFLYDEKIKKNIDLSNSYNILSIVIDKSKRRKGLGKILIYEFEKLAKKNKKEFLTLSVRKSNESALNFYKKIGFIPYKETNIGIYFYKKIKI